ncbi:MAG: NAD-dependent epimerase/dehydratase family protein [Chloroflexota bacterium]
MRIAILGIRGVPANYGGFETFAEELGARLATAGHDVTVYGRDRYVERGLRAHRGMHIVRLPAPHSKYLETVVHTLFAAFHAIARHYDIVYVCNLANIPAIVLLRLLGRRVVLNVDGFEWQRAKWSKIGRAYYRLCAWIAAHIPVNLVTDARVIQDYYARTYGRRTDYFPYGTELEPVSDDGTLTRLGLEPRRYVLYVSRLEPENNAHLVIDAFARVRTELPLAIVGDRTGSSRSSPYSAAKAVGDLLALAYRTTHGVGVVITRGANTYGPHQHPEKLVSLFITNALSDLQLPLCGDGLQRRSSLFVDDHADAVGHALDHGQSGHAYIVPGPDERTNRDITTAILRELGKPWSLVRSGPDRQGHGRRHSMDGTKLAAPRLDATSCASMSGCVRQSPGTSPTSAGGAALVTPTGPDYCSRQYDWTLEQSVRDLAARSRRGHGRRRAARNRPGGPPRTRCRGLAAPRVRPGQERSRTAAVPRRPLARHPRSGVDRRRRLRARARSCHAPQWRGRGSARQGLRPTRCGARCQLDERGLRRPTRRPQGLHGSRSAAAGQSVWREQARPERQRLTGFESCDDLWIMRTSWLYGPPGNDFPHKIIAASDRQADGPPGNGPGSQPGGAALGTEAARPVHLPRRM